MPHKIRRYRKRERRYRKRRANPYSRVSSNPVPSQKLVKLKYVEQVSMDPAAGSMSHFLFRANSLFDPNQTGTGHQPMGLDQWEPFYGLYTVVKSEIKVTFFSSVTTELASGIVGIYLNDDNTSTNVMDTMIEYNRTNHALIGPVDAGNGIITVRHSYSPQKMFGRSLKTYIGSDNGSALFSASPADTAVYDIFAGPIVSAADLGPVDLLIEVWYTAMLTDRATLASS